MIAIATKRDKWINFDTITSRSKTNINICFEIRHNIVKVRNSIYRINGIRRYKKITEVEINSVAEYIYIILRGIYTFYIGVNIYVIK